MRMFFSMIALVFGLSLTPTTADAVVWSEGEDLKFVTETTVPAPGGNGALSVCHLVDYMTVMFVPVYTKVREYALAAEQCNGDEFRALTAEQVASMQSLELMPTDLPVEPKADIVALLWGHAWLVIIALAIVGRALLAVLTRGKPRAARAPDALAIHSLVAMSQVAVADGRIDDAEVQQISSILTRLTGKGYAPGQVLDMLNSINPTHDDLAQVGQDLSEQDRQIVLEAAINIAVADGEIHPSEYAVVTDLAQRMRIGAEQFRAAMSRISAHLQPAEPA